MNSILNDFKIYAVTDIKNEHDLILPKIELALKAGVDIIQLRAKQIADVYLLEIGKKIKNLTLKYNKKFVVNDRVDIAIALNADGVHLGQDDMPIFIAKNIIRLSGQNIFIGKSTHSLKQALAAETEGADYIGVGPIFKTPTKKNYNAVGLSLIKDVKNKIKIPFVCIGGIDMDNIIDVRNSGGTRIAVVRAIFDTEDTFATVIKLKEMME